ncbi:VENN motif pre-toxin domain-containing protein, partial [Vagococcus sp. WN89Y]|uniref:VENN motif pre-toxin domain-containing protein n=1 Tax=Vagococcus sp. WN89Y TaxID=3457258 RepID=UPI003FCE0BD8
TTGETAKEGQSGGYKGTPGGLPSASLAHASESDSSTTHSAVAAGDIIIRDPAKQQQDVATLSRDTANAHKALDNNFDKEAIKDKLEIQQQATALGTQAMTVYMDSKLDAAKKQVRDEMAARGELNGLSDTEIESKVTASPAFKAVDKEYGIGSPFWTASSAMTGLLAGALGGNVQGGMAAGAAPVLAKLVKDAAGKNEAARIALHTVVSAALAKAQGGNATAGAIGGFIASAGAERFAEALYGKTADKLTPDEKMVVLNLVAAVSAAGGGVAAGDTAGMVSAGNAARVEVENNALSAAQQKSRSEELVACGNNSSCKASVRERYAKEYDKVQEQINTCSTVRECVAVAKEMKLWQADIRARSDELAAKARNGGIDSLTTAEKQEWINLRGAQSNFDGSINSLIYRAQMLGGSEETDTELASIFGHAAIANAASTTVGVSKAIGGKYTPNQGAVGNMGEFFKQPGFGSQMKENTQKTSQMFQGQSVYQAKKPIGDYITKGDKYYLDGLHKDHIEVFDSKGKVKAVLNIDGSYNSSKTQAAVKEGRRLPK